MLDSVPIGAVLLGKYRVDGVIGEGGMGIVLLAFHLQLHERVALKFPKQESLRWPGASARFLSEARAAIRIKSEHVARVVDVGTLDDGTPFIVMEYLQGETLSQYAARRPPLDVETIIEFITQVSEAIAEAHALGIVHRDLKPANIFLTRRADGILAAKVLDFGISQVTNAGWEDIAAKDDLESALGSPAYASPEQLQSPNEVDARTDVWSLGVIMYELATGRLPFEAETTVALCGRVIFDPFVPLRSVRPDLPMELCDTIDRCLEKRAEHRHASVGHLAAALLPFASPRARASIERIVRTIEMGNDLGSTLAPLVGREDTVLTRGLKAATGLLPTNRWRSMAWGVAVVATLAMTLRGRSSATSAEELATASAPSDDSGRAPRSPLNLVRDLPKGPPRSSTTLPPQQVALAVDGDPAGALDTGSVPSKPAGDLAPKDGFVTSAASRGAVSLPSLEVHATVKAAAAPKRPRRHPPVIPAAGGVSPSSSSVNPTYTEHGLDDPAYSNRK